MINVCIFYFISTDAMVEMVDNEGHPMTHQYYNPGSEIELACIIRNRSLWSTEIEWRKDGAPVDLYHRPFVRYVLSIIIYLSIVFQYFYAC